MQRSLLQLTKPATFAAAGLAIMVALIGATGVNQLAAQGLAADKQAGAAATLPATRNWADDIAQAARQLGAENFAAREEATRYLWIQGTRSLAVLTPLVNSDDPEIAQRAGMLVRNIKAGILIDTGDGARELIAEFTDADPQRRREIITQLQSVRGSIAALRLSEAENQPVERLAMQQILARNPASVAQIILHEAESAEQFLAVEVRDADTTSTPQARAAQYAAIVTLLGRGAARITELAKTAENEAEGSDALALAFLYRATGDLPEARRVAGMRKEKQTAMLMAVAAGDWPLARTLWKDLADIPLPPNPNPAPFIVRNGQMVQGPDANVMEKLARTRLTVAYDYLDSLQRPAPVPGTRTDLDRAVDAMVADAEHANISPDFSDPILDASRMLLLISRPQPAIDLLRRHNHNSAAYEILIAQRADADAQELLLSVRLDRVTYGVESGDQELRLAAASILADRGEEKELERMLSMVRADPQWATPASRAKLLAVEKRNADRFPSLLAAAVEDCVSGLSSITPDDNNSGTITLLLSALFPDHRDEVSPWWCYYRGKFPAETPAQTFRRLSDLFGLKTPAKEIEEAAMEICQFEGRAALVSARDNAVAGVLMTLHKETLTPVALADALPLCMPPGPVAKGVTGPMMLRLAARAKQAGHEDVARAWVERAWQSIPTEAQRSYRYGLGLQQTGHLEQGRHFIDIASLLSLADASARSQLVMAMRDCGQYAQADGQLDLIERFSDPQVFPSWVSEALIARAIATGNFEAAVRSAEQEIVCAARGEGPKTLFGCVSAGARLHVLRARVLLSRGDVAAAMNEAGRSMDDTAQVMLVPALAAHAPAQADDLYTRIKKIHEGSCAAFPKSPRCHAALALACAACDRDLPLALEHVQQALALDGQCVDAQRALAMTQFHLGHRDLAIAAEKKCLTLDPTSATFAQELATYETAPLR